MIFRLGVTNARSKDKKKENGPMRQWPLPTSNLYARSVTLK
jgi:hypothetical protein